jgi:hypothetical protein
MANEYVDQIILRYNGIDLDDVIVEFSESRKKGAKPVSTMNKRRVAKGYKRSNRMFNGTMKVEEIDDPRVPDWDELQRLGTKIQIIKIPSVGKKVTFIDFIVGEDITDSYSDGDSSRTVSWMALDRRVG